MKRHSMRRAMVIFGLAGASGALGFGLKTVLAEGSPVTTPLFYAGTLTENGQPVNQPRAITVNVWANPVPQLGESAVCATSLPSTPVINGRFRVPLDASCKAKFTASSDLYVEVVVGGTTSLGRAKIGAVPYAVEADHALTANVAKVTETTAWQALPLVAGAPVSPFPDPNYPSVQFRRSGSDTCFQGLMSVTQEFHSAFATLPSGFRPPQHRSLTCANFPGNFLSIDVGPDGAIAFHTSFTVKPGWVSFDGLCFPTAP